MNPHAYLVNDGYWNLMGGIWCLASVFQILAYLQLLYDFVPFLYLWVSVSYAWNVCLPALQDTGSFSFFKPEIEDFLLRPIFPEDLIERLPLLFSFATLVGFLLNLAFVLHIHCLFPASQCVSPLYYMQGPPPPGPQVYPSQASAHPQRSSNNIAHLEWKHMKWADYNTCHTWSLWGLRAPGTWKQLINSRHN